MLWKTVFVSLSALVGLLILLVISGHFRWQSETQALHDRLDQSQTPGPTGRVDFRELTDLPRPVQAYLRTVLTEGQPYIQSVALVHQGGSSPNSVYHRGGNPPIWSTPRPYPLPISDLKTRHKELIAALAPFLPFHSWQPHKNNTQELSHEVLPM